jgi:hypothetical protein
MIRILTTTGCVDVTDDHSLLREDGTEISPKDVSVGTELLHCSLETATPLNIYKNFTFTTDCEYLSCDEIYLANLVVIASRSNMQFQIKETSRPELFILTIAKKLANSASQNTNCIISMREIPYNGYVYDLTTDNHHFAAGIGNMIVHNTDLI